MKEKLKNIIEKELLEGNCFGRSLEDNYIMNELMLLYDSISSIKEYKEVHNIYIMIETIDREYKRELYTTVEDSDQASDIIGEKRAEGFDCWEEPVIKAIKAEKGATE